MGYKDPNDPRIKQIRNNHYKNNKEAYKQRALAKKEQLRTRLREVKDVPCMDCGIRYPYYVMDLDHRPGEVKLYEPGKLINCGSNLKFEQEIAKCDAVCSNCHRQRTFDRKQGELS